jgi:hypothetical protein
MRTALLAGTLAAVLTLSACTGADEQEAGAPDRATSSAAETADDTSSDNATAAPVDPTAGPLSLDDSRGQGCASLRVGREYTAWEHVLEPDADVMISGWTLVGATNVEADRGFVAELPRRVPATGFTLGFPPGPDVVESRNIDWEDRRPAVGATLDAGSRSNFWVRIKVAEGVERAGYRGLQVRYVADGQEYTALSDIRMRFRGRCR